MTSFSPARSWAKFRSGLYWRSSQTGTEYLRRARYQSDSPWRTTWVWVPETEKARLLAMTPAAYTGAAAILGEDA